MNIKLRSEKNIPVLALGPESAGNFSFCFNGEIFHSRSFGDLLEEKNFAKFKKELLFFLRKNKIKPMVILTDLHPLYKTTGLGAELAKKFSAKHLKVQHHIAHIFSVIGEKGMPEAKNAVGIACDGTGYGLDGKIWGGECFTILKIKSQISNLRIERIGHLENQTLIGGDLAIKEPARMLVSILSKFLDKKDVYNFVKKYYTRNQFELLYNQLKQDFNCQETSSTGRVLDAVSVLLGFSGNERKYKHAPVDLLEKNSTEPYGDLKPKIIEMDEEEAEGKVKEKKEENEQKQQNQNRQNGGNNKRSLVIPTILILETTSLFEYLVKNLHRDKKRLAAAAQLYLAKGLYEIANRAQGKKPPAVYFAGGMANNKIMSEYMKSKGAIMNEKIPRGDAGLSFGQIAYYLSANSGN